MDLTQNQLLQNPEIFADPDEFHRVFGGYNVLSIDALTSFFSDLDVGYLIHHNFPELRKKYNNKKIQLHEAIQVVFPDFFN